MASVPFNSVLRSQLIANNPLNPPEWPARVTILMIPPVPSESYCTPGEVMISIFLAEETGKEASDSTVVGTPSMSSSTLAFPLTDTMLSESIRTAGDCFITSKTDPVAEAIDCPVLITVFSAAARFACFVAVITVSDKVM